MRMGKMRGVAVGSLLVVGSRRTPDTLARQVEALAADPEALANAAARALSVGRPNAAKDLADLVERIANKQIPLMVGPAKAAKAPNGFAPAGAVA